MAAIGRLKFHRAAAAGRLFVGNRLMELTKTQISD